MFVFTSREPHHVCQVGGKFPALRELDVSSNALAALTTLQTKCDFPVLTSLDLQKNSIPGYSELSNLGEWWSHGKQPLPKLTKLCIAGNPWMLEEGFDEGKHPTEVLVYVPQLMALDLLPIKDEENDVPFPTPEQVEEATNTRQERQEAEKAEAERCVSPPAHRILHTVDSHDSYSSLSWCQDPPREGG